jgi:hypothetical protein
MRSPGTTRSSQPGCAHFCPLRSDCPLGSVASITERTGPESLNSGRTNGVPSEARIGVAVRWDGPGSGARPFPLSVVTSFDSSHFA